MPWSGVRVFLSTLTASFWLGAGLALGCDTANLDVAAELPGPRLASLPVANSSAIRFEFAAQESHLRVMLRSGRSRNQRYGASIDSVDGWFELHPSNLRRLRGRARSDARSLKFAAAPSWLHGNVGSVASGLFAGRRHIQARFIPHGILEAEVRSITDGDRISTRHLPEVFRSAGKNTIYRRVRLVVRGDIEFNGYRREKDVKMRLLMPERLTNATPVALQTEQPITIRLSRFGIPLAGESRRQGPEDPDPTQSNPKLVNRADNTVRLVAYPQLDATSAE